MSIATKPVTATVYGAATLVQVKAWERCALGTVTCDNHRHTVEASCLNNGETLLIDEANWSAFQRIPQEDLPGLLEPPKDMKLCAGLPK